MFEFLKSLRKENSSGVSANLETKEPTKLIPSEPIEIMEVEEKVEIQESKELQVLDIPKFIIKEEAKIMSIPCDHKNKLPQIVLKIDKTLVTNPNNVATHVNVAHFDEVNLIEEGMKEIIDIQNPCGGPGTIKGEVLLAKAILIGGVHYSVILYDTVQRSKIYDGEVQFITAYTLLDILPFGIDLEVDPDKVKANFTTVLTKLDDIPGVDFYLYTVDGEVTLELLP